MKMLSAVLAALSLAACGGPELDTTEDETGAAEQSIRGSDESKELSDAALTRKIDVGSLVCRMIDADFTRAQVNRYLNAHGLTYAPCERAPDFDPVARACRMLQAGFTRAEIGRFLAQYGLGLDAVVCSK